MKTDSTINKKNSEVVESLEASPSGAGGASTSQGFGEASIFISDKAKSKVIQLMTDANVSDNPSWFLRVGVVGGWGVA